MHASQVTAMCGGTQPQTAAYSTCGHTFPPELMPRAASPHAVFRRTRKYTGAQIAVFRVHCHSACFAFCSIIWPLLRARHECCAARHLHSAFGCARKAQQWRAVEGRDQRCARCAQAANRALQARASALISAAVRRHHERALHHMLHACCRVEQRVCQGVIAGFCCAECACLQPMLVKKAVRAACCHLRAAVTFNAVKRLCALHTCTQMTPGQESHQRTLVLPNRCYDQKSQTAHCTRPACTS